MAHIFISCSRDNQQYARELAEDIRQHGFDVWLDIHIDYGDPWWRTIVRAVEACSAFIIIMSPAAEESEWVEREILLAQRRRKPIFPLLLEGNELALLINTQYVDVRDQNLPPADFYERLRRVITPADQTGQNIAPKLPAPRPKPPVTQRAPVTPVPTKKKPDSNIHAAYIAGIFLLVSVVIAGIFGLWQGVFSNANPPATMPLPTSAVTQAPTEIPTLSIFEISQTAEAEHTQAAVTQAAFNLNLTAQFISDSGATARAQQFTVTETAAYATLLAFSGAPTSLPPVLPVEPVYLSPAPIALTPVARNPDWTPIEQDFNGVTMVLVPVGCFDMGSSAGKNSEQPVHRQCLNQPFWIDKYEVTQAQFDHFGGVKAASPWFPGSNHPVENISWIEARSFCLRRGARLPSEAEWEYAARGPDAVVYPWGDDLVADNVVYVGNSNNRSAPVGSRPGGASWVGALDMSGNVWEWTNTIYDQARFSYPYVASDGREDPADMTAHRVARGGSLGYVDVEVSATIRNSYNPYFISLVIGFRCARSL